MTGGCSTGSTSRSVPGWPGGTCRTATGSGRPVRPGSAVETPTAPAPTCSPRARPGRTRPGCWTGGWPSAPPSCGPTKRVRSRRERGTRAETNPTTTPSWSPGGLTTKIHLACDGTGRPPAVVLNGGNRNDHTAFQAVLAAVRVPRLGPGRPRTRPEHLREITDNPGYQLLNCCD